MPTTFYPLSACRLMCEELQTALAASVCHLFVDGFTPTPSDLLAAYSAVEADFSGYLEATIDFNDPILSEGVGYMIQSDWMQWAFDPTPGTPTNNVAGLYLVDAGGDLRLTIIFDELVPFQVDGQGLGLNLTLAQLAGV